MATDNLQRPDHAENSVEVRVQDIAQLFHTLDPFPFREKDLEAKNLARHGIDVVLDVIDAGGRRIGEVLETYAASSQIDVLVMGAYGHARWREFVLGGATRSLLSKPPLPILFSH